MKIYKQIYIKAYTKLNVGDDLFVFILCTRYPNVQFFIKDAGVYTKSFKNIHNLNVMQNTENIHFDAIVYIGGSIFMENSPISVEKLLNLKEEIIKVNIPTYIIGANFGPYISSEYFYSAKNNLFPHLKSVTFRDKYSCDLFKDMKHIHYAPDVVFSMDIGHIKRKKTREIGISLIHHLERANLKPHYNNYISKLLEICRYYIKLNYKIRLFSFCEYEKDMVAINDLLKRMNKYELQHIIISNYTGNLEEMINKIANLNLFITSRFHSMVLGLKFNIPIIPICYNQKCTNVLNDIGFPKSNIYTFEDIKRLDYTHFPEIFFIDNTNYAKEQFKDLDTLLSL